MVEVVVLKVEVVMVTVDIRTGKISGRVKPRRKESKRRPGVGLAWS